MLITLSVQSFRNEAPALPVSARFDQLGGALGRAAGNDLVLDDPSKYISRVHARIEFRDGGYYLVDVGSNPSMVNGQPLGAGKHMLLNDRDQLAIGDYLLLANVESVPAPVPPPSPLQVSAAAAPAVAQGYPDDSLAGASILNVSGAPAHPAFDPLGLDLFAQRGPFDPTPNVAASRGAESDHVSPEFLPFPMTGNMAIPDDYDPLADFLPPRAVPAAMPATAPPAPLTGGAASDNAVIQALMRGMGLAELNSKRSAEEIAELAGAMLREATSGTMGVLTARAMTKRESRLEMTMISSQANNPLKFFPDADSALMQMMTASMAGYMAPVRAFGNAFDDLKAHELAMMAGMRAALAGVLQRFDPDAIEQRLQVPTVMDKMLGANRKAKMWDSLVALYRQMALEADQDFQRLFGEAFGAAYEEQIARLQQGRR